MVILSRSSLLLHPIFSLPATFGMSMVFHFHRDGPVRSRSRCHTHEEPVLPPHIEFVLFSLLYFVIGWNDTFSPRSAFYLFAVVLPAFGVLPSWSTENPVDDGCCTAHHEHHHWVFGSIVCMMFISNASFGTLVNPITRCTSFLYHAVCRWMMLWTVLQFHLCSPSCKLSLN